MTKKRNLLLLYFCSLFVAFNPSLCTHQLHAVLTPIPSAGVIERDIEREYEAKPFTLHMDTIDLQIDIPEEKLDLPEGKTVLIKEVQIYGNDSICCEHLLNCINDSLNKELSIRDIYEMCHTIDQHYARQGYFLSRAYPPPQAIENNVLYIEIIEGKLGNIEVVGNEYYSECFIRGYFAHLQNKPLRSDEFLKALLLLNEFSDLAVGAVFKKGTAFGTGDVILRVEDDRPAQLYLNGNNYGMNLTTNTRVGARLDWGNFIRDGDTFSIAEVVGMPIDSLNFTDITYWTPVNSKGTSVELSYLYSNFKIEKLNRLHLHGRTDIATIEVNHALTRTRNLSIDLFSYFDFKQIQNFVLCRRSSFDKLRVLTFGTEIDQFIPWLGRDLVNMRIGFGIPDFLGGLKAVDDHSSRRGGGGRFFIFNLDYDHLQQLPWCSHFFYFHGSAQWSPNKLTLPEQFYIGGDGTVRGYPLAAALGDSGYYVNFEYRLPPPYFADKYFFNTDRTWRDVVQFGAFVDLGAVRLNPCNKTFLCGTGINMRIFGPYTLCLSADLGFPVGNGHYKDAFIYIKLTAQPF